MSAADAPVRSAPFTFNGLTSLRKEEVGLWNLFHRVFPGETEGRDWVAEALSHLLVRPSGERIRLAYRSALDPQAGEQRFVMNKDEVAIGRAPESDVVLAEKAIGRCHARVFRREDGLLLEDLGSQFGTHIGGRRLDPNRPERLRDGGRFAIFPYEFRVDRETDWAPESPARIRGGPAQVTTWQAFEARSAVGAVLFPLFIHPAEEPAWIEAGADFLVELVRRLLQPLEIEKREASLLPGDESLIEFTLLSVLEVANRTARFPFRIELGSCRAGLLARKGQVGSPAPLGRGVSVSFTVGLSGFSGAFRLFVPYATLAGLDAVALPDAAPELAGRVSWALPVCAGWVDLLPEELAALELRDILLYSARPAVYLPGGFEKGWGAVIEAGNHWRVRIDNYFDWSMRMQETTGTEAVSASGPDLRTLPVRLHVVVGEKELTLAEIGSLAPNTILELGAAKSDPVKLAVNGKIVGHGELVEVDGKLGVKILGWH